MLWVVNCTAPGNEPDCSACFLEVCCDGGRWFSGNSVPQRIIWCTSGVLSKQSASALWFVLHIGTSRDIFPLGLLPCWCRLWPELPLVQGARCCADVLVPKMWILEAPCLHASRDCFNVCWILSGFVCRWGLAVGNLPGCTALRMQRAEGARPRAGTHQGSRTSCLFGLFLSFFR